MSTTKNSHCNCNISIPELTPFDVIEVFQKIEWEFYLRNNLKGQKFL